MGHSSFIFVSALLARLRRLLTKENDEIEDSTSICTLKLVYEMHTSYSLDQGTIFIDPVKIPVSFQSLPAPLVPHSFSFSRKASSVSATWRANWLWRQKFGSHCIRFREIAAELRHAAATIAFPDKVKLRLFQPFSIHDADPPIPGEVL